ncbi:MAG: type II toxin-antitoxin system RelE/ParE family toxin [Planctomycetota bacterium]|nr:type II toxin-antitoxin system RelE/ParE family toxin [Planctomycetota bacterium]
MAYRVELTSKAHRELANLPRHAQKRIVRWLDMLAANPRRSKTRQLEGAAELRRVHAGKDYVIVYTIRQEQVLVLVVRIAHRKEVYRNL